MTAVALNPHLLRTTEAAVVSGVGVRDVDRVIDEKLLPSDLVASAPGIRRGMFPISCLFISFYYGMEKQLTSGLRRSMINRIRSTLLAPAVRDITNDLLERQWLIEEDDMTIDIKRHVERAVHGMALLREARGRIHSSEDTMGGAHVIAGTRIMVSDLAAAAASGRSADDILLDYEHPLLTSRDVELASVFERAYPTRGRPSFDRKLKEKGYRALTMKAPLAN